MEKLLSQEHEFEGRRMEVNKAVKKGQDASKKEDNGDEMKTNKLFIGRLQPNATAETLREKFEVYGALTDSYVPKDHNSGGTRGFGFVTFESMDAAEAAFQDKEAHK